MGDVMKMDRLTFEELEEKMVLVAGEPGVAESHGALSGMLCSAAECSDAVGWFRQVFPDARLEEEQVDMMMRLHRETRAGLVDDCFVFSPLLPDDSRPIEQRVEALGEWCQGFMLGLSVGGLPSTDELSADAREVLQDLAEMGQVDSYQLEGNEQDERSYTELVEYLRTGVLLLHAEMLSRRQPVSTETLH